MIKFIIVRHGESVWNKANKFTGWTDVKLTKKGKEEAKQAGKLILKSGFDFSLAFTSVLKRSIDTLSIIEKEIGIKLTTIKDWRLNERHYGALQGLNKTKTAKIYGDKQVLLWRRSAQTKPPQLKENDKRNPKFDKLYKDIKEKLPLGESLLDTEKRVIECLNSTIKENIKDKECVLIVAHGNSIRALIKHLENVDDKNIMKIEIPTGEPLVYELSKSFKPIKRYYLKDKIKI